jgi:heme/copper-type cytochrome/quinol oxidase subunit 4
MSKKDTSNILSLIGFILFVVWAIATVLSGRLDLGSAAAVIENIARFCAFFAMAYFAYLYYAPRKKNTAIAVLFWLSIVVGIVAIVLPFFGL